MTTTPLRKTMLVALAALLQLAFVPRSVAGTCPVPDGQDACCCVAPAPGDPDGSCCDQPDPDPAPPTPDPCGCEQGGGEPHALPEATTPERDEVAVGEMAFSHPAPTACGAAAGHRPVPVPRARAPVHLLHCVFTI